MAIIPEIEKRILVLNSAPLVLNNHKLTMIENGEVHAVYAPVLGANCDSLTWPIRAYRSSFRMMSILGTPDDLDFLLSLYPDENTQ